MERDPNRIDAVILAIHKVWLEHPEMRLGQLLVNAIGNEDKLYNFEDTALVRKLNTLAERLKKAKAAHQ